MLAMPALVNRLLGGGPRAGVEPFVPESSAQTDREFSMYCRFFSWCLLAFFVMSISLGCGSDSADETAAQLDGAPPPLPPGVGDDENAAHAHPTEGPHGGHLIELGNEEYHAELLHDENTHTVTIHLLDGPATQAVSVPLPEITLQLFQDGEFVKYGLKAVPGPEDAQGSASRFELVDKSLCDAFGHEDETRGRLQITIAGKPFTGTIDHDGH